MLLNLYKKIVINISIILFIIDDVDNFILDKDTYRIFSYFKELN